MGLGLATKLLVFDSEDNEYSDISRCMTKRWALFHLNVVNLWIVICLAEVTQGKAHWLGTQALVVSLNDKTYEL